MRDYSKTKENVSYYDCEYDSIHEFGKSKSCNNCNYYDGCMVEKEISDFERNHDKALERFYSRMENEEYPL